MAGFHATAQDDNDDAEPLVIGGLTPWRERLAKRLIHALLGEKISVPQLAQACALSRSHFSRAFLRGTGWSPQAGLHRQRSALAPRVILGGARCRTLISAECGFCDQAHFSRTFSRTEGVNPAVWRNRLVREAGSVS
ncbi:MAG: AraC family transcriptional regulator [Pseudomonas sp.]